MPPANMNRKNNKRELERAVNNLAWCGQHIQVVFDAFQQTALELAQQEQEIPDSYVETMNALDAIMQSIILIGDSVNEVNNSI